MEEGGRSKEEEGGGGKERGALEPRNNLSTPPNRTEPIGTPPKPKDSMQREPERRGKGEAKRRNIRRREGERKKNHTKVLRTPLSDELTRHGTLQTESKLERRKGGAGEREGGREGGESEEG